MIRVELSDQEKAALRNFRKEASPKEAEKALMVLLNSEGCSAVEIAKILKRSPHTVRRWLNAYAEKGLEGLKGRNGNGRSGRPPKVKGEVRETIKEILSSHPREYGYNEKRWSAPLIGYYLYRNYGLLLSESTIRRVIRECDTV